MTTVKFFARRNAGITLQERLMVEAVQPAAPVKRSFKVSWKGVATALVFPAVISGFILTYQARPLLEDNVEWVYVYVNEGQGYDAAIRTAYKELGEYNIARVDIRDLRYLAEARNDHEGLLAHAYIEVPVYTGTKKYR